MTTQAMLDDRYGRTRRPGRRRAFWVAVGAIALFAIGWLGWTAVTTSARTVSVDDTGYTVQDERVVEISFQISAPADRTVACALEALDEQFGIVGWKIVEYPADADHANAYTEQIPTVAEATTGLVNSCWVA